MYVLDTAAVRRALRDLQKRIAAVERRMQQLKVKDDAEVYNFRSHQSRTIKKENRPPLNDDASTRPKKNPSGERRDSWNYWMYFMPVLPLSFSGLFLRLRRCILYFCP